MTKRPCIDRRTVLTTLCAAGALPHDALAEAGETITWDDLIPPGLPYGEIIGPGIIDEAADFWRPEYDANSFKMNEALNGKIIRMPGYIIPLEQTNAGVPSFLLVPYVGACIHTPPPPPNQLVLVDANPPWPNDNLWDPVWVTGLLKTQLQSTELAEIGYHLTAQHIEIYS
ncbi:DUF3299 domain-containing protein [Donghicola sp. XS_ASV15]|uniref:DUF3299 domain-containing protein n=1 Tax=Donghicola sp. XS_ASV15 TaxID=3241295 RepID=UPI0035129458